MAPGITIIVDPAPIGSDFDNFRIYKSTTKSGTFSAINGNEGTVLTNPAYFDINGETTSWYKTSYYDTDDDLETDLSDAFQPQDQKYTTIRRVEKFMRLTTLTNTTTPSFQEVADLIKRSQDQIDYRTGHAWRKRYSGTKSGDQQTAVYERYDIDFPYEYQTGRPVRLQHRKIYTLDADEGDALEIWDGSSWENWITSRTERRDEDFWFDYEMGELFINQRYWIRKALAVRIKYRYGETTVNRTVEDICTKLVAIDLLYGESRNAFIPEGSSASLFPSQKIDRWKSDIEDKLAGLKEFQMITNTM